MNEHVCSRCQGTGIDPVDPDFEKALDPATEVVGIMITCRACDGAGESDETLTTAGQAQLR